MKKKNINHTIIFVLLFVLGCNSDTLKNQNIKSAITGTLQKEIQVDSFKISISTTGGFTGLGSGYTLASNGTVRHWKELSFVKDTTLWEREADLLNIIHYRNFLDTCGILQKQYNEVDNMTTTLTYNLKDTSYTWSWKCKGEEDNTPLEIKKWYEDIVKFCNNITE